MNTQDEKDESQFVGVVTVVYAGILALIGFFRDAIKEGKKVDGKR